MVDSQPLEPLEQKVKIFVHIGVAKAASTTFQKHLFDKHPEIHNLGIYPTGNLGKDSNEINYNCAYLKDKALRLFYSNLVMLDGLEYRFSNNIKLYEQAVKPCLKFDKINLFSYERFTSVLFSHDDIKIKAERLKEIFPNAKIILVIRNQTQLIISQYRDHPFDPRCVRIGKPVSIDKWIKIALDDQFTKYISSLNYYGIVTLYAELFGRENIGVFLFEDLVHCPDYFAEKISEFLGINSATTQSMLKNKHENLSVSGRYNLYRKLARRKFIPHLESLRFLPNSWTNYVSNFLKEGKKGEYKISPAMQAKLHEHFAPLNDKLQEEYQLDLKSYNYPLT
ncbi:MAG: sulfotransferase [Coleofasciculus sp. G1-WW12-02]|uniref:sulfotransferase n=1 Tax=Coleofasciculus sp. G1-WW12-02 TaxID=3068483 RepID=UPI0032F8D412